MPPIINTRSDLDALKGGPDYAGAMRLLLGASTTWLNVGTPDAPQWERQTVLGHIERLGFTSLDELLAECAAAGIAPAVTDDGPPPLRAVTPVSATMVKAEAQARIVRLTGANDLMSCIVKQLNANMRANELNDIRYGRAWTAAEEAEAAALRSLAEAIKAIRAASNVIEAMTPIPADYAHDWWWTPPPP